MQSDSPNRRPPAAEREVRKVEASHLLVGARRAAGLTATAVADACGCSRTLVRSWEDDEDAEHPVPLDVVLVPELLPHAVRLLAERAGLAVAELPSTASAHDDLRLAADVQRECAEAVGSFLHAISDGIVTRAENARVREEAHHAVEALTRLIRTLEATAAEPVCGVRRIGAAT